MVAGAINCLAVSISTFTANMRLEHLQEWENAWLWHLPDLFVPLVRNFGAIEVGYLEARDGPELVAFQPFAVCPTGYRGELEISMGGWSLPYPAIKADYLGREAEILSGLVSSIDLVAERTNARKVSVAVLPQQDRAYRTALIRNPFLEITGFLGRQENTSAIDIAAGAEAAVDGIRSRYRRYIRRNAESISITPCSGEDLPRSLEADYQMLCMLDSSQQLVGQDDTVWKINLVRQGHAIAYLARHLKHDEAIGILIVLVCGRHAFDFSVAVNDDYKSLRVSHALKESAIRDLATRNVKVYELGIVSNKPSLFRVPSEKQRGITDFKMGFSNMVMSLSIVEKFYSSNYMHSVFNARVNSLSYAIFGDTSASHDV